VLGLLAASAVAAVAVAVLLGRSGPPATAQGELGYTYSAKFICGTAGSSDPLLPGQYSTAINVHNLQDFSAHVYKKAVLAPPESQSPGVPTAFRELAVPADAAFEIDCADIRSFFDIEVPPFIKGFVVIESPVELDVWGVYTSTLSQGAPTNGNDIAEDIEVVPFTRQPFPPPGACIDRLGDTHCDDPVNDPDDDGCATAEEQAGALPPKPGSTGAYNPNAWYDFYDVPVPAKPDAGPGSGANGIRDKAVAMDDVLAVLFYVGTYDGDAGDPPNPNGVRYDTIKGVDLNGDTTNDIPPPLHQIKEGVKYDRLPGPLPNPPWEAASPDGAVAMDDVLANLAQVGLDCSGPP
jgi:hypothetical protein